MIRKTFSLHESVVQRLQELATEWNVSQSEVIRRLFGFGNFIVQELKNESIIYSEKDGERTKLVIPY